MNVDFKANFVASKNFFHIGNSSDMIGHINV